MLGLGWLSIMTLEVMLGLDLHCLLMLGLGWMLICAIFNSRQLVCLFIAHISSQFVSLHCHWYWMFTLVLTLKLCIGMGIDSKHHHHWFSLWQTYDVVYHHKFDKCWKSRQKALAANAWSRRIVYHETNVMLGLDTHWVLVLDLREMSICVIFNSTSAIYL